MYTEAREEEEFIRRNKLKRVLRALALSFVALAVLFAGGFLGIKYVLEQQPPQNQAPVVEVKETQKKGGVKTPDSPFVELVPDAPVVTASEETVTVSKDHFLVNDKPVLKVPNGETKAPNENCVVVERTDFCLAGQVNKFHVFYMKDPVRSKLFLNAKEIEPTEVRGALFSAFTDINIEDKTIKVHLIITPDGNGWVLMPYGDQDIEALEVSIE